MGSGIYGLLGRTLRHSYSPEIHACLGEYEYQLFEMEEDAVSPFLAAGDFTAINVTIPYKKTVMPYLSEISDEARKIGSVNTITRTPAGGLRGDNTDYYGFSYMLDRAGIDVAGQKCLILGSGGASVTARAVITDRGGTPIVISRTGEDNYDNLERHADARILVNTTPVGMYPENGVSPIDLARLPHLVGVVDMIYNPRRTALVLDAMVRGIPAVSGLSMLVAQAKRANELFFMRPLPDSVIEAAEKTVREGKENIILIGMPGVGKTVAGQALAEMLSFTFADTDAEILRMTGRTAGAIIREDGEDAFRQIEHEAVCALGKQSACVIATGGGVVTRPYNRDPLRQNGTLVYLTRPIAELATAGRPLSAAHGVASLHEARHPIYTAWADAVVEVVRDPAETAKRIWEAARAAKERV